jgi:predicted protein tyrosine phosphatase
MDIIKVLSRRNFEIMLGLNSITDDTVETFNDAIFISILTSIPISYSIHHIPVFKKEHPNVLVTVFDDVIEDNSQAVFLSGDPDNPVIIQTGIAITDEQADQIVDFVITNKDKEYAFIHCAAGISRSGAVGAFINEVTGGDWNQFKSDNKQIQPNPHVYNLLMQKYINKNKLV